MSQTPYQVLGIEPTASQEEKEKAWKLIRSKHHPDKGGDPQKFKEAQAAWDQIKDLPPQEKGYERTINFNSGRAFNDFFHKRRQSQYVNIDANISVRKAVNGGQYVLSIQLANSSTEHQINIDVPSGVTDGETVTYPNLLLGHIDVMVTFHLIRDNVWSIEGLNVIRNETFDFWELILGTTRDVETIAGTKIRVVIPPMTQPGTKLRLKSHGSRSRQNYLQRGDMLVHIQSRIPEDIPDEILVAIRKIRS